MSPGGAVPSWGLFLPLSFHALLRDAKKWREFYTIATSTVLLRKMLLSVMVCRSDQIHTSRRIRTERVVGFLKRFLGRKTCWSRQSSCLVFLLQIMRTPSYWLISPSSVSPSYFLSSLLGNPQTDWNSTWDLPVQGMSSLRTDTMKFLVLHISSQEPRAQSAKRLFERWWGRPGVEKRKDKGRIHPAFFLLPQCNEEKYIHLGWSVHTPRVECTYTSAGVYILL